MAACSSLFSENENETDLPVSSSPCVHCLSETASLEILQYSVPSSSPLHFSGIEVAMQTEDQKDDVVQESVDEAQDTEALELVLFQVSECYVYMIPPRKSAASFRAYEWDVNKWACDGVLKVISKGEECIIRVEDKRTGELFARAFLRHGEAHPVEPAIDSSRYFVLRMEENIGGRLRHAFIGIGFRERTEAYDFQAALHDHMKYLNKKKTASKDPQLITV